MSGGAPVDTNNNANDFQYLEVLAHPFWTQSVAFGPLADHPVSDAHVTVAATASSFLPVTFTTSTPSVCTAGGTQGATITLLAGGTCTVIASQAGTLVYSAATPVTQSFSVTAATQTITFGALADRSITQSPFSVSASASSGLAVVFKTTTPTVCTSSGTNGASITLLAAGTCTVEADQAGNGAYLAATGRSHSRSYSRRRRSRSPSARSRTSRSVGQD